MTQQPTHHTGGTANQLENLKPEQRKDYCAWCWTEQNPNVAFPTGWTSGLCLDHWQAMKLKHMAIVAARHDTNKITTVVVAAQKC